MAGAHDGLPVVPHDHAGGIPRWAFAVHLRLVVPERLRIFSNEGVFALVARRNHTVEISSWYGLHRAICSRWVRCIAGHYYFLQGSAQYLTRSILEVFRVATDILYSANIILAASCAPKQYLAKINFLDLKFIPQCQTNLPRCGVVQIEAIFSADSILDSLLRIKWFRV
jgi:hypothetical protein